MTLDEAIGRIFRRHLLLIAICIILPVAGLLAVHNPQKEYLASARVKLTGGPASSTTEADAISNGALAVATAPTFVKQALREAGVHRGPLLDYIKNNITVTRQGESSYVDVTVKDTNKTVASYVDSALANQVVLSINGSNQTSVPGALASIDKQLKNIRKKQTHLQTELNQSPNAPDAPAWQAELTGLSQLRADLVAERSQITLQDALLPLAVLVDAHEPVVLDTTFRQLLALAVLLGVLLGLAAASVVEMLRPTVPSPRALSRLLEAPVLGRLHGRRIRQAEVHTIALAAARAAHRLGVGTVAVTVAPEERGRFAGELAGRLAGVRLPEGSVPLRWTTPESISAGAATGILLVAPYSLKRRGLEPSEDLRVAAGWPLLGIVTVPRRAVRASRLGGSRLQRLVRRLRPAEPFHSEPHAAETDGELPGPGPAPLNGGSRAPAPRRLRRCTTVGLHVEIDSRLGWVGAMLDEAMAGDALRRGQHGPADLRLHVEREHDGFDVSGWQVVTRGVYAKAGRVVLEDACSTGFDLLVEPSGPTLDVRARWSPALRSRAAATAMPSRFHLLVRCALLQYPALWWAGVHGGVPLHASAIRLGEPFGDTVVLLAGPGGVGKSTLLETELAAGGQATCDNVCVARPDPVNGVVASGLLEPLRVQGGKGRRMPNGRAEKPWAGRVSELTVTRLVVVRRGRGNAAIVRGIDPEEAARALVGGTYAAGELRRYWPFAASLALGTGLGPAHPPLHEGAQETATLLPCSELLLPSWTGIRLADALATAEAAR